MHEPLLESVWIEPYPDEQLGLDDGLAGPEARYEQRESIELAFIAALQYLPARQGQLAVGAYELDSSGVYAAHGVTVLTLKGDLIDEISHFRDPSMLERFGLPPQA